MCFLSLTLFLCKTQFTSSSFLIFMDMCMFSFITVFRRDQIPFPLNGFTSPMIYKGTTTHTKLLRHSSVNGPDSSINNSAATSNNPFNYAV